MNRNAHAVKYAHMALPMLAMILGLAIALVCSESAATPVIVNISATTYGYAYPTDPAPVPGQVIQPLTNPGGMPLNQLSLAAGTYLVTNATGMAGANPDFTAWNFNLSEGDSWTWEFVIANDATDKVIIDGESLVYGNSQAAVANDPAVKNFSERFTLASPTTLDFMVRDWYLADNAGGVAISIAQVSPTASVPEPSGIGFFAAGLLALAWFARKRVSA